MRRAAPTAVVQFALIGLAFAALKRSVVVSDFIVPNVIEPMLFKLTGRLRGHGGPLRRSALILVLLGATLAVMVRNIPEAPKSPPPSVQTWIKIGFFSFVLSTSNPFAWVFRPLPNGRDLNPGSQDVGLAMYALLFYVGSVDQGGRGGCSLGWRPPGPA